MRIPTREDCGSMNLGQAVAICLYELARDAKLTGRREKISPAAAGEQERLTTLLVEALQLSGYVKQSPTPLVETRIRRLVRRLQIPEEDVESWMGFLRQILWKL